MDQINTLGNKNITEDGDFTIGDFSILIARQLKIVIIIPTISVFWMLIYVIFFSEPLFESTSKLISSSRSGKVGSLSQARGLAAQFGISLPTGQTEPNWVYEDIIKSKIIAKRVLYRKFDTREFGKQKTLLQILTYGNEKPSMGSDTLNIIATEKLLNMITVRQDLKTSMVTLNVTAPEPELATTINAAIIEEVDKHQRDYNKGLTSETKKFIQERIINTEKELKKAEESLKTFRDRNRRIQNSPALLLEEQRFVREVTVLIGVFTTLKQQLETTKIEEVKDSDYVLTIDPPSKPLYPYKPNKKLLVIFSAVLGIFVALVVAFINDFFSKFYLNEKQKIDEALLMIKNNLGDLGLQKIFRN